MAQESFGLRRIGQIAVNAHDQKKMTAFYRDTLGLKFLFEASNMAFFDCDGIRLMLSGPERPEFDHAPSIIYFKVSDIRAAHRELAGRSVRFKANRISSPACRPTSCGWPSSETRRTMSLHS